MLKQLWSEHRNACLLTLALLVIGIVVSPWVLLATVLPVGWVLLKSNPAKEDQPLTINEETESMSKLPKNWAELDDEQIIEKLKEKDLPKEIFSHFVNSENWEVRQAIALNQDTPSDVIEQLRKDEDDDVKDTVSYRELPEEWRVLDNEEKIEKLKEENIDLAVIEILSNSLNCDIRKGVAVSPSTPESIVNQLRDDDDTGVRDGVAYRDLPNNWRYATDLEKIKKLKEEDSIDSNVIETLSKSSDPDIREGVAVSPSTPESIVNDLREDDYDYVKDAVTYRELPEGWRVLDNEEKIEKLKEENIDLAVIEILSNSLNWDIRKGVAVSPSTPESIVNDLREDDYDYVRDGVAYRDLPNNWRYATDLEKIKKLKEEDSIDSNVIEILSNSSNDLIRVAVALCSSTPSEIIEKLANDRNNENVKDAVAYRELPEGWRVLDNEEKIEKLKEENIDLAVIEILLKSSSWTIRKAVAASPSTSEAILKKLCEDNDSDVQGIAMNSLKARGLLEDD